MNLIRVVPILLLLILQNCPIKGAEKYTVTRLNNDEVIYLEMLSKVKLYHEQWKIVIGFDLLNLEENYETLKNAYNDLYKRCFHRFTYPDADWTCSSKYRLARRLKRINEVVEDLENVQHLAGLQRKTRTKRGLFDFIGEISKTLFGTLADTDASYYNSELDKLYSDQKNVIQYVKNQTSIILKTLSSNRKTIESASTSVEHI